MLRNFKLMGKCEMVKFYNRYFSKRLLEIRTMNSAEQIFNYMEGLTGRICGISILRYGYYVLARANHELHVHGAHTATTVYSDVRRTHAYAAMTTADVTTMMTTP